jgi:hypothetical protein
MDGGVSGMGGKVSGTGGKVSGTVSGTGTEVGMSPGMGTEVGMSSGAVSGTETGVPLTHIAEPSVCYLPLSLGRPEPTNSTGAVRGTPTLGCPSSFLPHSLPPLVNPQRSHWHIACDQAQDHC